MDPRGARFGTCTVPATETERILDDAEPPKGERSRVQDVRSRAASGTSFWGTIDAWLIAELTGNHVTDVSNASGTIPYDIHNPDGTTTSSEIHCSDAFAGCECPTRSTGRGRDGRRPDTGTGVRGPFGYPATTSYPEGNSESALSPHHSPPRESGWRQFHGRYTVTVRGRIQWAARPDADVRRRRRPPRAGRGGAERTWSGTRPLPARNCADRPDVS